MHNRLVPTPLYIASYAPRSDYSRLYPYVRIYVRSYSIAIVIFSKNDTSVKISSEIELRQHSNTVTFTKNISEHY